MNEKYYIELIKEKDFLIAKQSKTIGELATKYFTLEKDVKELALENKRLRDIISKNSSNSSKPPSSDYAKKHQVSVKKALENQEDKEDMREIR